MKGKGLASAMNQSLRDCILSEKQSLFMIVVGRVISLETCFYFQKYKSKGVWKGRKPINDPIRNGTVRPYASPIL